MPIRTMRVPGQSRQKTSEFTTTKANRYRLQGFKFALLEDGSGFIPLFQLDMADALKRPAALRSSGLTHPDEYRDRTNPNTQCPPGRQKTWLRRSGQALAHKPSNAKSRFILLHQIPGLLPLSPKARNRDFRESRRDCPDAGT